MNAFHCAHTRKKICSHEVKSLTHTQSLPSIYIAFVYHAILIVSMTFMVFRNDSKRIRLNGVWRVGRQFNKVIASTNNNNNEKSSPSNLVFNEAIFCTYTHTHARAFIQCWLLHLASPELSFNFVWSTHSLFFHNFHFLLLVLAVFLLVFLLIVLFM